MTVDCAVLGRRLNEARNGFSLPDDLCLPNLPADLDWRNLTNDDPRLDYGEPLPLPGSSRASRSLGVRLLSSQTTLSPGSRSSPGLAR